MEKEFFSYFTFRLLVPFPPPSQMAVGVAEGSPTQRRNEQRKDAVARRPGFARLADRPQFDRSLR